MTKEIMKLILRYSQAIHNLQSYIYAFENNSDDYRIEICKAEINIYEKTIKNLQDILKSKP